MKKTTKKLQLAVQTVKTLVDATLGEVRGGRATNGSRNDTCSCQGTCNNIPAPPITTPL
jgi:hypothetical protein